MSPGQTKPVASPHGDAAGPQSRPRTMSHPSMSAPPTPHQRVHDDTRTARTPSPGSRHRKNSPGSISSESSRAMPSMRAVSSSCRFQSTQTSRRRMPYNIGSEPLAPETPSWTLSAQSREQITQQCNALYEKLLPSPDSQRRRDELVVKLQEILGQEMPESKVKVDVFGSSGNLLYTSDSDVDVCVTMFGQGIVCSVAAILAKRSMKNVTCVHAKSVPIVKIWDSELEMACDLNVNNQVALINTRLVRAYMQISPSARELAMLVKHWTQRRVLNEASGGTLSSYTWTLLVINYLQTLKVLPVISLTDSKGKSKDDFTSDVESLKGFGPKQPPSTGDLFYGFFEHYGFKVDFETAVFSVRSGIIAPKAESRWSHIANNNRLCVEEPFNTTRNLGNTADDTAMRGVHLEMREAARNMGSGTIDIDGIICKQFEFPREEHRHSIFERPAPQPRPVLTRSRSQAGRGGARATVNSRSGNRNFDSRTAANRRASSATAYAQIPIGLMTPEMWAQMDPYTIQQDLHNLNRHLSHEQERLRQVQQAIFEQRMQQSSVNDGTKRRSFAGHSLGTGHYMGSRPGSPGSQSAIFDNGPRTAPMFPSYANTYRFESGVPMSQSSSYQGTSSRQSSPMLAEAVPIKRTNQAQMQVPDSPSGSQRSRSQPARPVNQGPPLSYPFVQWGPSGQPIAFHGPQQHHPYLVPRYQLIDPRGIRYVQSGGAVPREYVGYGINSQNVQQPAGMELSSIPAYEDLRRQGRPRSPVPREDDLTIFSESPSRQSDVELSGGNDNRQLPKDHIHGNQRSISVEPLVRGPVIVNGSGLNDSVIPGGAPALATSYESLNDSVSGSPKQTSHRNSDSSARSFADRAAAISYKWAEHHGLTHSDYSDGSNSYDSYGSHVGVEPTMSSYNISPVTASALPNARRVGEIEMPIPGREGMNTPDITLSPSRTFAESPQNGQRRASGHARPNLAPLDLGLPSRARDNGSSATKLLSPVQETRTPSPTASRKSESKRNSLVNAKIQPGSDSHSALQPTGHAGSNDSNIGPSSGLKSNSGARAANQTAHNTNQWQQAGGRKKKNRASQNEPHVSGGMPMPANVAERKGG